MSEEQSSSVRDNPIQPVLPKPGNIEPEGDETLLASAAKLIRRFHTSGKLDDLEEAIKLMQEGIAKTSVQDPNFADILNNLANGLLTRFEYQGSEGADLDEAISLLRQVLKLRPPSNQNRAEFLNNLAAAVSILFEQRGDILDLDEAILLYRQAIQLTPPSHPYYASTLNNLAASFFARFEQQGDSQQGEISDLDEALSSHRQALKLRPPPHPYRSNSLNNLASALFTRFKQLGKGADLDEVISLHRKALELRLPPHTNRPQSLNNLANALEARSHCSLNNLASALFIRFEERGADLDLDEAISLYRRALEFTPSRHPDHATSLNNLANALFTRFESRGEGLDNRPISLNNLAYALSIRFEQQNNHSDLDEVISLHRQALNLTPPTYPEHASSLNNLANALFTKFKHQYGGSYLDEAILLHRQALELMPSVHPNRSKSLNNLANALRFRFKLQGEDLVLDEAISLDKQALELLPPSHPRRFITLGNLALHHIAAHKRLGADDTTHLQQSMSLFSQSLKSTQPPLERFYTARMWAENADLLQHSSALEAYEAALHVLPQLGALNLNIELRQKLLTRETDGIAREAAKYAIHIGQLGKSVEYLETGRGVFWSQFLRLRSPFDRLQQKNPKLGDDIRRIASELERGSHRDIPNSDSSNRQRLTLEEEAKYFEQLSKDWSETLDKIRKLEGFEDFLCPQSLSTLQTVAQQHPIVYLVANDDRGMRVESGSAYRSSSDLFRTVLEFLWDEAVKPVIDFMGFQKSDAPPMLKWCPTGLFTFLPIHAAGRYQEGLTDCASEYIISSYTPTIGVLLSPDPIPSPEKFKMLAVIQSRSLPSTVQELEKIEQYVSSEALIKFGVSGAPASVEAVASSLSAVSVDYEEAVPNGSLAFLSACETAKGDEKIPDEAMSLAASLLFSGFRSVVATMWKMWDTDGPVVADAFYKELFKGPDGVLVATRHH
ncbi:hypothetical protein CPB84DRAFT_1854456 [Gymnopilus junonius]|uniref:CHAT domain-containing protein n=1 Tax=Gymnopilus junonius TaxID=109634 RepID=A0A9P5N8R4_GYMJU|nr:hypothetical protein CPB84DRAFT_1854456 [Gymnopilus junonius]